MFPSSEVSLGASLRNHSGRTGAMTSHHTGQAWWFQYGGPRSAAHFRLCELRLISYQDAMYIINCSADNLRVVLENLCCRCTNNLEFHGGREGYNTP